MASGIWPEVPCHVCKTQEGLRAVLNIEIWPPATLIRAARKQTVKQKKGGQVPFGAQRDLQQCMDGSLLSGCRNKGQRQLSSPNILCGCGWIEKGAPPRFDLIFRVCIGTLITASINCHVNEYWRKEGCLSFVRH
jgi:hypothetical protein